MKILHAGIAGILLLTGCAGGRISVMKTADAVTAEAAKPDYDIAALSALASGFKAGYISDKKLLQYSDAELARLFSALSDVTFYLPEQDTYVELQERVFRNKSVRNTCDKADIRSMYKAYLGARMFAKADALRKKFPDIKFYSMPEKVVSDLPPGRNSWRVYNVLDEGKTVELRDSHLGSGSKVAMLMLPGCEVAEAAMQKILAAPDLAPAFRRHGMVMTNRVNAESVALWKSHFNFPEVFLAYKASDFPGFDFHSSPTFYFLVDGKVRYSFSGWSRRENPDYGRNELLKGFAAISVSTSPAAAQ